MRADSIATSNIRNRIGSKGSLEKVADVRLLLEEKRQNNSGPRHPNSTVKSGTYKLLHCAGLDWLTERDIFLLYLCSIASNLREFCSAAVSAFIQFKLAHKSCNSLCLHLVVRTPFKTRNIQLKQANFRRQDSRCGLNINIFRILVFLFALSSAKYQAVLEVQSKVSVI